jgi:hypothetical protein
MIYATTFEGVSYSISCSIMPKSDFDNPTLSHHTPDPSAVFLSCPLRPLAHRHMATAALIHARTKAASKSLAIAQAKDHANKTALSN